VSTETWQLCRGGDGEAGDIAAASASFPEHDVTS